MKEEETYCCQGEHQRNDKKDSEIGSLTNYTFYKENRSSTLSNTSTPIRFHIKLQFAFIFCLFILFLIALRMDNCIQDRYINSSNAREV